jgi:menaquinone-dependent protoporphyrinogen IX oxidase
VACAFAVARAQDVAGAAAPQASATGILLVTDESEFKDAVTAAVQDSLKAQGHEVTTITRGELDEKKAGDYGAVIIINTIKAWHHNGHIKRFVKGCDTAARSRIVLVSTTASSWKTKLEGVHAISTASEDDRVKPTVDFIISTVRSILGDAPAPAGGAE